ncbi:hypothetical protein CJ467_21505 [Bacillus velezensis]|uniref:hypothetical protein n=1 Tax=Bacillus velezensis TaxID=492670 RepID=UPI00083E1465|nr:hypothetical protein [Bacillus velezensis]AZJ44249.1 hypothetical protein EG882_13560 [Bacillus velezensis]ODB64430.1 hypothetical protein A7313_17405 [Bacillus velezensis]PAK28257.1 hypothetical protein CJ467_21505 [Bacillus velezensis]
MKKKLIIGALVLGLIPTIGSTAASAKPLQNPVKVINPLADDRCKGGGTLICETGIFSAKGTLYFDYYGSEDDQIRIYIANDGKYPFEYRITNPDGKRIADGLTVKPGKSTESTFYVKDIEGTYKVRVTNDDGEDIKAFVKARGL